MAAYTANSNPDDATLWRSGVSGTVIAFLTADMRMADYCRDIARTGDAPNPWTCPAVTSYLLVWQFYPAPR